MTIEEEILHARLMRLDGVVIVMAEVVTQSFIEFSSVNNFFLF